MTSVRAQVITRRTYNRPTETGYETWEDTVDRVIQHLGEDNDVLAFLKNIFCKVLGD